MRAKLHFSTKVVLAVVVGAFLLANVTECPLVRPFDLGAPATYGPVARYFFVRGWPLSPCMVALYINLSKVEADWTAWAVLVADVVLALVILAMCAVLCEWVIWRWRAMKQLPVTPWGKVDFRTKVVFIAMIAIFAWANSQEAATRVRKHGASRAEGIARSPLLGRGWPLSPWRFAPEWGKQFHLEAGLFCWALAINAVVAIDSVLAATLTTEFLVRNARTRANPRGYFPEPGERPGRR